MLTILILVAPTAEETLIIGGAINGAPIFGDVPLPKFDN